MCPSAASDQAVIWRLSAECIRVRSTEEGTMQKIWFIRLPKWQRTQDMFLCSIPMLIMPPQMLATKR